MNEIKVNRGIVVKVNDAGETISINVDDQRFIDKFYDLIDRFDEAQKRIESEESKNLSQREKLKSLIAETEVITKSMDDLFGEGASRKIFGDIVPSPYLLADFFDQMLPITKKYTNERQRVIEQKYSRNRKGARSKR